MTPEPRPNETAEVAPQTQPAKRQHSPWGRRIASLVFIVFCLELGLFLLTYPWTDSWSNNYFSFLGPPAWHAFWTTGYVKGAVSGLGLVNIWVAIAEALRMYIGNE